METTPDEKSDSKVILFFSDPQKIRESNTSIIKEAQDRGYTPIVTTINFPASILEKLYLQNDLDTSEIYFIDAISKFSTGPKSVSPDDRHIFLNTPSDLTNLSIAISEMLKRNSGKRILILIDSISTMLIYLPSVKISQFVHIISSKIRQIEENCTLLAVEGGLDPVLYSQIRSFVDDVVEETG